MRLIIVLLAALSVASCATTNRVDAAGDVHAFLTAVRDSDRDAFETHVDRRALTLQLESRLRREVRASDMRDELKIAAALLAGPVADMAGNALIRPSVFRAAAIEVGYDPARPLPPRLAIAAALRPVDGGRVCAAAAKDKPCLFTFAREDGVWRLTAFDGDLGELKKR